MTMKEATGLVRWFLLLVKRDAVTIPPFGMYCLPGHEGLEAHEKVHWQQYEQMGLLKFYLKYFWYQIKYGYQNNPMEIEARKGSNNG